MHVTLTNKKHPERWVQFHWPSIRQDYFVVIHDTTLEHEYIEIINADAHTGDFQMDGWEVDFDADTWKRIEAEIRHCQRNNTVHLPEPVSSPESDEESEQ